LGGLLIIFVLHTTAYRSYISNYRGTKLTLAGTTCPQDLLRGLNVLSLSLTKLRDLLSNRKRMETKTLRSNRFNYSCSNTAFCLALVLWYLTCSNIFSACRALLYNVSPIKPQQNCFCTPYFQESNFSILALLRTEIQVYSFSSTNFMLEQRN